MNSIIQNYNLIIATKIEQQKEFVGASGLHKIQFELESERKGPS